MGRVREIIINHIDKLKINKYSRIFNENQIKEIKLGLIENLDVKCYANNCFDEYQMREIRYGLEEGLDVKSYAKKHYDKNQMREIRLNLERISNL